MLKKLFGVLQKAGKALMLPVALLPAAGLLLGIGNAIGQENMIDVLPFLQADWIQLIGNVIEDAGNIIFSNLALLFAAGVAIGLAGDGVAALAAIVGYLVMNQVMGSWIGLTAENIGTNPSTASVLGIPTLQTGVFGGIIVGLIAAYCYNKYHDINMPTFLGFFAGKRFVPIVTAAFSLIAGLILLVVWPPIQSALNSASIWLIDEGTYIAVFMFGFIKRLLIPFGLHHIYHAPFWYEFGSYTTAAGDVVRGDMTIFFAQLRDGVELTAGHFMAGEFPIMMFGLPAAALAMYHTAKPEKKKMVAGLLVSAALTSFLTGITEPIEFTFLFLSPVLFLIHALLDGFSFVIMTWLDVNIGYTFSGGAIDFFLFGILPGREPWWLTIIVGFVFAVLYYFIFRFFILKWDLKTPGREEIETVEEEDRTEETNKGELPFQVIEAMGGQENIIHLDACITRLRFQVKDMKNVDKEKLKKLGASGFLEVGNNIQAIFGPKSDTLKSQMQNILNGKKPHAVKTVKQQGYIQQMEEIHPEVQENDMDTNDTFIAPIKGTLKPITEVPDYVFSAKLMGDGFAIEPEEGLVVAPTDGTVINVLPTKHALSFQTISGREMFIHFGIDTFNLKGEGFEVLVNDGEQVKAGQPLLRADLDFIKERVPSIITPIVFTNLDVDEKVVIEKMGSVQLEEKGIISIE
ncbi:glucose-specific PTS transporter subunit IIBC [Caldifermentibacillus hisashii]|uniref:glucose-specific PTS transporter subunit IIBC n=1 Tax=Caldifermentibacillus hisashii TaxID=996558 RepID=UPI0034D647A8